MVKQIDYATFLHEFAAFLVAQEQQGVCALLLGDTEQELVEDLQRRFPKAGLRENKQLLAPRIRQVASFLSKPDHELRMPLSLHGTEFQQSVWQVLQQIPLGSTMNYSQIAQQIGKPTAMRAVARACASNPVALVVACHRVLRIDGGISGYRWGVERKRKLLELEHRYAQADN